MDTAHRKIELQSPSDLTFLTTQIRTAARQKLDLHLPPVSSESPNEPDELRKHVEDLVDAFVAQVLNAMRHNISINGIDVVGAAARGEGNGEGEGMEGVVIGEDGGDLSEDPKDWLLYTLKVKEEGEIGVGMCVWSTSLFYLEFSDLSHSTNTTKVRD